MDVAWGQVGPHLADIWGGCLRAIDDIKDSVRDEAKVTLKTLGKLTVGGGPTGGGGGGVEGRGSVTWQNGAVRGCPSRALSSFASACTRPPPPTAPLSRPPSPLPFLPPPPPQMRLCNPELSLASEGRATMNVVVPFLLREGEPAVARCSPSPGRPPLPHPPPSPSSLQHGVAGCAACRSTRVLYPPATARPYPLPPTPQTHTYSGLPPPLQALPASSRRRKPSAWCTLPPSLRCVPSCVYQWMGSVRSGPPGVCVSNSAVTDGGNMGGTTSSMCFGWLWGRRGGEEETLPGTSVVPCVAISAPPLFLLHRGVDACGCVCVLMAPSRLLASSCGLICPS
jgi:hypothetical protein